MVAGVRSQSSLVLVQYWLEAEVVVVVIDLRGGEVVLDGCRGHSLVDGVLGRV